jgi:hypothetical protein
MHVLSLCLFYHRPHEVQKKKKSAALLAEEMAAQSNKLISPWTARFLDSKRESDFLYQRIYRERWGLFKKFFAMFCLSCGNGSYAYFSGYAYGPSQYLLALSFSPVIIAIPLKAPPHVIRGLVMVTNVLFGLILNAITDTKA